MNIKDYLKKIEITKVDLAKSLNISRPTLDQYIELFEKGQKIENDRYEIIFNRLFSDDNMAREQFDLQLDSVKFLLERDKRYDIGKLKPGDADIVATIHNCLVNDMSNDQSNRKVYNTILILLRKYHSDIIMRELCGFFSDLNSDTDISELDLESKAYYSYFYNFFSKIINKTPNFDEKKYDEFLNRRIEISTEKKKDSETKTKHLEDKLKKILEQVEIKFKNKGIDASEDEMVNEVIRMIKN